MAKTVYEQMMEERKKNEPYMQIATVYRKGQEPECFKQIKPEDNEREKNTPVYDICADECISWIESEFTKEKRKMMNTSDLIAAFTAGFSIGYYAKR